MSACAIPVDWVFARAVAAVSAPEPVDISRLMEDCNLDLDEAVALLNIAAYQVGVQFYLEPEPVVVLH